MAKPCITSNRNSKIQIKAQFYQNKSLKINWLVFIQPLKPVGPSGCAGVYLDDQASGIKVSDNLFYRMPYAVLIGGGRDIVVERNVCVLTDKCFHLDNRGEGWQKKDTDNPDGQLRKNLSAVPFDKPPYAKYPHLSEILDDSPGSPKRIEMNDNTAIACGTVFDITTGAKPAVIEQGTHIISKDEAVRQNMIFSGDSDPNEIRKAAQEMIKTVPVR